MQIMLIAITVVENFLDFKASTEAEVSSEKNQFKLKDRVYK